MTKINEALRSHSLVATKYEKLGKITIITTSQGKYIFKNTNLNYAIINYLKSRSFDYFPRLISNRNDNYQISEYIEDYNLPKEQKILDLIHLVALLHSKTTHYKEVDINDYESLYEDLSGNITFLYTHYTDLITLIESKVYMSPSQLLLARNISKIYETLDNIHRRLEKWHNLVKEKRKQRNVVLHNNLKLTHFICNQNSYLISWDKAKIGSPVFDIYKLYKNHELDFDFSEILFEYERHYPLMEDEKELFYILISFPEIIEFNDTEYNMCRKISNAIDKIYKAENLISPKKFENRDK